MSRRLSVRSGLVIGTAALCAALVAALSTDQMIRQQRFLHDVHVADVMSLTKGIARAGAATVLAGDVSGLHEVLQGFGDTRELRYAFIVDDEGRVLAHTDRALIGKFIADDHGRRMLEASPAPHLLVDAPGLIDTAAPVLEQGRAVAWVRVGVGTEAEQQARDDILRRGLLYGLAATLIGLVFAVWLGHRLTRDLYRLLRLAEAVRGGGRTQRADTGGVAEVGTLATAFNGMLDSLAAGEDALRRLNTDLERRVAERTADLTAAGDRLRKSEALFRAVLDSSGDAILLVEQCGTIVLANPQVRQVFGYDREELVGQPIERLVPRRVHDHVAMRDAYRRSPTIRPMGTGREVAGRRRDGSEFPAEVRLSPVPTEDGLIISAVVRDITERQEAEDRLRASEHKHRLLFESLPNLVFYKDLDSRYLAVNPVFAALVNRTPDDIIGRTDWDLMPPEQAQRIRDLDLQVAASGNTVAFEEEFPFGGENRTFQTIKAPVRDSGGAVIGLLGMSSDITERKRAEAERTEAVRTAEAANRAKSDFLANMSHEIRTPMNAVIGLTHLLGRTALDARQRDYLNKIDGAANALLALLNDILDVSKVEAGKLELETRRFRLDALLRNLATILSVNAQDKDIEILFRVDSDVPTELVGDELRLNQVLINLAGNAIKFTEAGEVVVSVAMADGAAEAAAGQARLRFSIRDTGIGITPEQRDRLFQAFSQADSSTSRRFGGSGLGLAISRRLVELMGGCLEVESEPGRGSDFRFTAVFGQPVGETGPARCRPGDLCGLRVLVVDDNPTAREVMAGLATQFGWHVDVAADGAEALAQVERSVSAYDLVLLDWKMPGMGGFETSRRLRDLHPDQSPPIILVITAYARAEVLREAADGIDGLLMKPVTASMLFDAVAELKAGGAAPPAGQRSSDPPARPLAGLRLLVAEDNAVNQEIVCEMLMQAGAAVVQASNGAEAVAAVETTDTPFDLILMDIQMPVLDGYAATRALRGAPRGRTVPIVAMTANALASDRERCLAAGMDDHVPKPIDPDRLVQSILIRTGRAPERPMPGTGEPAPTGSSGGIDLAAVRRRLGGDEAAVRRVLSSFGRLLPQSLDACRSAVADGDAGALEAAAHALKGMAANVGAGALSRAAADLGQDAREGRNALWPARLADLERSAQGTVTDLAPHMAEVPEDAPVFRENDQALRVKLNEVAAALADDSFAAGALFEQVSGPVRRLAGDDAVDRLAQAIESFDYDEARRLMADLVGRIGS